MSTPFDQNHDRRREKGRIAPSFLLRIERVEDAEKKKKSTSTCTPAVQDKGEDGRALSSSSISLPC